MSMRPGNDRVKFDREIARRDRKRAKAAKLARRKELRARGLSADEIEALERYESET